MLSNQVMNIHLFLVFFYSLFVYREGAVGALQTGHEDKCVSVFRILYFCISNPFMKRELVLSNQVMKINVLAFHAFPLLTSFSGAIANCKIAILYLHLKSLFALLPPRRANSTQFSFGRQIGPAWSNQVVRYLPKKMYNKRKELVSKLSIQHFSLNSFVGEKP